MPLFKPEFVPEFFTLRHSTKPPKTKKLPKAVKTLEEITSELDALKARQEAKKAQKKLNIAKQEVLVQAKADRLEEMFSSVVDEELLCGNPNCYAFVNVYDGEDLRQVHTDLVALGWQYFKRIECWLCPPCKRIQIARNKADK
jgi:ABC-type oligopeptide transport system substrate-binding subunit